MKRIKASVLDRWTSITQAVQRREHKGDWIRGEHDRDNPSVVTENVSRRLGEQRFVADVNDLAVLKFIIAAKLAMPQLIDTLRLYERALDDVRGIVALRHEISSDETHELPIVRELQRALTVLDVAEDVDTRSKPTRPRDRVPARGRDAAARTARSSSAS